MFLEHADTHLLQPRADRAQRRRHRGASGAPDKGCAARSRFLGFPSIRGLGLAVACPALRRFCPCDIA